MAFNLTTGKIEFNGQEGTPLWCERQKVKLLERIADSLEKIYEYISSSERVPEKTKRNTEKE